MIDRCIKIETRQATEEEILSKHTAEHINLLESTENFNDNELEHVSSKYDSIYVHPVSCFKRIQFKIPKNRINSSGITYTSIAKMTQKETTISIDN